MRLLICILACTLFCARSLAQTSLLQDYEGKSALNLPRADSIMLTLNAADAGLTLAMTDNDVPSNVNHWFSGQLKLSGKDGKFPVFKGGVANFQIEGGVTYTWMPDKTSTSSFFYGSYKAGVSRVKVVETDLSVKGKSPLSHKFQIGYNNLAIKNSNLIIGLAVQAGWGDNTSEIDSYDYKELLQTGPNPSGTNTIVAGTDASTVYKSAEYLESIFSTHWIVDFGYSLPKSRILPMIHLRWNSYPNKETVNTFSPGMGVYYTAKDDPGSAIFGLQLFFKDWTDEKNKGNSRWDRSVANAVVGFKF